MSRTSPRTSRASSSALLTRSLFLFRNDLRLSDHAGLAQAARFGDVVPALVIDSQRERRLSRNSRRAAYFCGAVSSLHDDLARSGSGLVVRRGPHERTVVRLAREIRASAVCWSAAYDAASIERDRSLQATLEEAGFRVSVVHDATAVSPDDTAAARSADGGDGYRALTPYVAAWRTQARAPVARTSRFASTADVDSDVPSLSTEFGVDPEPVSESSVSNAFEAYLAGPALAYRTARNIPAGERTARLSAPLSFGVLSARTALARIDERSRDPFLLAEERASLAALTRGFAQRDFFLQLGWFFAERSDVALQPRMRDFAFARSHAALDAWRTGRTGFPLVDAGMRQLIETGWMHPRVRLVAASFLCFDLGVDWRIGRDAWDDVLVEDDPALATGNWQWSAGVGADLAAYPRIFNPGKQVRFIDPRGAYVRRWIPELAGLPDASVLDPGGAAARPQLEMPLFGDASYPSPVVDHEAAARTFLARYAAFVRPASATRP